MFGKHTKHYFFILLAGWICSPANAQYTGDTYQKSKTSKKASLTYIYVNTPGFTAKGNDGRPQGLLIDLINAFHEHLKREKGIIVTPKLVETKNNNFKMMLDEVKVSNGGVFGVAHTTITQARKKVYNFSLPFISNVPVLITHKDVPNLSAMSNIAKEFAGKTAFAIKGATHEKIILDIKKNYFPDLKIQNFGSDYEVVEGIGKSKNAFGSVDFAYYLNCIKEKMPVKRHAAGDGDSEEFGILMPKNSDWTSALNAFLAKYLQSSDHRKSLSTHLGQAALKLIDSISKK